MKCPAAQINKLAREMADTTDPTVIQVRLTVFARQLLKDACDDLALMVSGLVLQAAVGPAEQPATVADTARLIVEQYPDRFCF
jgi:uncharacterized protein (DUF1778 family)